MPASIQHLTSEALQHQAKELAHQLRQRRKVLGVSVQNAAAAAGMSRDTWYRMECGETTVTIGAWFNALAALGLRFGVAVDTVAAERPSTDGIPLSIPLADYPQLAALAWQMGDKVILSPREALDVYERNVRHLDEAALTTREKALIANLRKVFG
jgi:transcriptional regulator with XRE-family HTH domain